MQINLKKLSFSLAYLLKNPYLCRRFVRLTFYDQYQLIKIFDFSPPKQGGYCRHTVIDNPSDRIYRALSWLFAMTSACCAYWYILSKDSKGDINY